MAKSALYAASLNVFINTKAMKNKETAEKLNAETDALLREYSSMADEAFEFVNNKLR
jgi:formiminotetrahydrofolate cyclodeaminase